MSELNLLDLEPEVVWEILLLLPAEEILSKCRTSTFFREICNSEDFWRAYSKGRNIRKSHMTWKRSARNPKLYMDMTIKDVGALRSYFVTKGFSNKISFNRIGNKVTIVWNTGVPLSQNSIQKLISTKSMLIGIKTAEGTEFIHGLNVRTEASTEGDIWREMTLDDPDLFDQHPQLAVDSIVKKLLSEIRF